MTGAGTGALRWLFAVLCLMGASLVEAVPHQTGRHLLSVEYDPSLPATFLLLAVLPRPLPKRPRAAPPRLARLAHGVNARRMA